MLNYVQPPENKIYTHARVPTHTLTYTTQHHFCSNFWIKKNKITANV